MNKRFSLPAFIAVLALGYFVFASPKQFFNFSSSSRGTPSGSVNEALAAQFGYLSKNGNSSCSASFKDSVDKDYSTISGWSGTVANEVAARGLVPRTSGGAGCGT